MPRLAARLGRRRWQGNCIGSGGQLEERHHLQPSKWMVSRWLHGARNLFGSHRPANLGQRPVAWGLHLSDLSQRRLGYFERDFSVISWKTLARKRKVNAMRSDGLGCWRRARTRVPLWQCVCWRLPACRLRGRRPPTCNKASIVTTRGAGSAAQGAAWAWLRGLVAWAWAVAAR